MIRKRYITALTFLNGILFRTKNFVPDYRYTLNFIDTWDVDEIVVFDITGFGFPNQNFVEVVRGIAARSFVPITVGGNIRCLDDVKALLNVGADKICLNSGAFSRPDLITEITRKYGVQSVVLSVDYKNTKIGREVFINNGTKPTGVKALDWIHAIEKIGVGEILLTSIDHDGSLEGADIDFSREVANTISTPLLIRGGIGNWQHFYEAFTSGRVEGVCTQNIYHFTETSIKSAKKYLQNKNIMMRIGNEDKVL